MADANASVFVAEDEGVIGFCDLIPSRDKDGKGVAEIQAWYVHSMHWRKGAGKALWKDILAEARHRGFTAITLWVLASNEKAKRFYETMGFALDGATKTEKMRDGSELREVRFRITI